MKFRKAGDYDIIDSNMQFGTKNGKIIGLTTNNRKCNRSANVLVIGGTGTGKTFKYIKPNLLQENCSIVVTDPSGELFQDFAPYLAMRGYNVYLINVNNPELSNRYNPLLNVYNANGEINELQVDILVNLYLKNASAGKEAGKSDPFWEKSEKMFLTALIYYVLENDEFSKKEKTFNKILTLVQKAKKEEDAEEESELTQELNAFYKRMDANEATRGRYKTKQYYDSFLVAPEKTANTILVTTVVDLQLFATKAIDNLTTYDTEHEEINFNIEKVATQQSYIFLSIPQHHEAYNFLVAMLYSQLYAKLYELGEGKLANTWCIGKVFGLPSFCSFRTKEEAIEFYETVDKTDEFIIEGNHINNTKVYNLVWKGRSYKTSFFRETIEAEIDALKDMFIWNTSDYAGKPALPIHINFLLDEWKNIGEIPNFLKILSTSRKYRIGSHVILQDLAQAQTVYKDKEYETLVANVDTTIFLGSILPEDKEYIQKMLGKTTINQRSTSSSNSGLSVSGTPTEVSLMSVDEISDINQRGRDDEIVIIRDFPAIVCQKLNLFKHKRWKLFKKIQKKIRSTGFDINKYYDISTKKETILYE